MSDIEHVVKASTQSAPEAEPIGKLGSRVNATLSASKKDLTDDHSKTPRSTLSAFIAKPALSACRPPLFRR